MAGAGDAGITAPESSNADAEGLPLEAPAPPLALQLAYREALKRYDGATLASLALAIQFLDVPSGRAALAVGIAEHLGQPRVAERVIATLSKASRLGATLFALTEASSWSSQAFAHAAGMLGVDPAEAARPLLAAGLLALSHETDGSVRDPASAFDPEKWPNTLLVPHPSALSYARTVTPDAAELPRCEAVRNVREADGLEPVLRMAVVWQRVNEAPLRQTQTGTLYKRDRDRIEDDPVLASPIADAMEPLPDMPAFWLAMARGVGLVESEPGSERVTAARHDYWSENAFHLPQMAASRWLNLRTWHEQGGLQREGATLPLALPYARPAVLLWLATLEPEAWTTVDDFAEFLHALASQWDRVTFPPPASATPAVVAPPAPTRGAKGKAKAEATTTRPGPGALLAMLLGPGYQLGLIRTAQEASSGRTAVQLTALGRYLLALGPPPPPRPSYQHFLFVQPNFEIIAYRQGLTPGLAGQFSRFALWDQIGAALAIRLTADSIYRGLEGGLTPQAMLDLLTRHSSRPLPAGIAEALKTWAGRRDRVSYHAAATLIEFATEADRDAAMELWGPSSASAKGSPPSKVGERLLLVEDESTIPFARFRMTGSRDYRRPPEACVVVDPDGVNLALDLARSDLLVDAELTRFADEAASNDDRPSPAGPRRRFVVSGASLDRAAEAGMTPTQLAQWYQRRTGADMPPSVRLLLSAKANKSLPLTTSRPLILNTPSAEVLDGLAQHPDTRGYLGERLGPTTVVVPDVHLDAFRKALERLGLTLP